MRMAIDAIKHRRGSSPSFQAREKRCVDRLRQDGEPSQVTPSLFFPEQLDPAGDRFKNDDQSDDESRWHNEGGMRFP